MKRHEEKWNGGQTRRQHFKVINDPSTYELDEVMGTQLPLPLYTDTEAGQYRKLPSSAIRQNGPRRTVTCGTRKQVSPRQPQLCPRGTGGKKEENEVTAGKNTQQERRNFLI